MNFPRHIESGIRTLLIWTLNILIGILAINAWGVIKGILITYLLSLASIWAVEILQVIGVMIIYGKKVQLFKKGNALKLLFFTLMFPFFEIIGKWSMYIALFKKVEWKPIPHNTIMDIDELNKNQNDINNSQEELNKNQLEQTAQEQYI